MDLDISATDVLSRDDFVKPCTDFRDDQAVFTSNIITDTYKLSHFSLRTLVDISPPNVLSWDDLIKLCDVDSANFSIDEPTKGELIICLKLYS